MPSLTATSATASVELTSPGTSTRSGCSASSSTGSIRSITRAVWTRVGARADAEHVVGLGHAELLEEDLGHHPVVVLAGVDEHMAGVRQPLAAAAAMTGAILTKFGLAPIT